MSEDEQIRLPPSGIGEAAKYNFSPWFIKMRFQDKSLIEGKFWNEATKPLSTVQSTIGNEFEQRVYDTLEPLAEEHINEWYEWGEDKNEEQLIDSVKKYGTEQHDNPCMMTQVRLKGFIGEFEISGDSDLVVLFSTENGIRIHVIDIKSSWDEKPSQQLQTATYTNLIRDTLSNYDFEFDYEITGGILFRETPLDSVFNRDETPSFHTETREGDVKRILQEDGPFDKAFNTSFEDLPLTLDKNSPYAEVAVAEAVESGDISIIGVTPGEKEKLHSEGIENIVDLAELYQPADDSKPYNYTEPERNPEKSDTVENLVQEAGVGSRISTLSHRAQSILGVFQPDHPHAHDKPWYPWISGSGNGDLPEDDPPYSADMPIKRNSMIRVYLDVQHDHVRDEIVSLSGVVTSGLYDGEPLEFSNTIDDVNRDPNSWRSTAERELLQSSISDMYDTIQFISDFAGHGTNTPIHYYLYDENSHEKLYESVKRHENTSETISSFRRFLDMRDGVDQKMFSIVQKEIESRMATKDVDLSIQNVINKMYPSEDEQKVTDSNWIINDSNGNENDLREAYEQYMFDNTTPISYSESSSWNAEVLNTRGEESDPDDFYNLAPRSGSQIPIEYLWASEDIGLLDESWAKSGRQESIIRDFMWVNDDKQNTRLNSEYYQSMSRVLARCVLHVERSIAYRNSDITKKPINIQDLEEERADSSDLGSACLDYLDLESKQTREDAFEVYSKPLKKRIVDGDSVPMEVTGVIDEKPYMFKVKGRLILDELGFENPIEIAGSSNIKGSDSSTGGSRCVATPLVRSNDGYDVAVDSPRQVESSVKVSVEAYDPESQYIEITGYRSSSKIRNRYVKPRKPWSLEAGSDKRYVGPGEMFVLDPSPDSMMAEKSIKALENMSNNKVYKDINLFRSTGKQIESSMFKSDNCEEYIHWIKSHLDFIPNRKQQDFIKEEMEYSLLQGPPGTGKTSGAISHSIMARAYDQSEQDERLVSLVSGLSNKSIDEVMEDVDSLKSTMNSSFGSHPLENLRLIRLSYGAPTDPLKNVEYLNYRESSDIEILRNILGDSETHQKSLGTSENPEHIVIFATPGRIDGLMGEIDPERTAEEMYEDSDDFFDLAVVDEGSMMPMYQLFMITPFLKENKSQLLIGGDHRQLPPVQKYDWSEEKRKSIQVHLPHLSSLDYFRYLKGEDVDGVYEDSPKSPSIDIPIVRLNKTYRCHSVVTDFLRDSVYMKDGISYYSEQYDVLDESKVDSGVISQIVNPSSPISLIIHDDISSQQVNIPEKNIIDSVMSSVQDYSSGIVTPHNAQKGLLRVTCPDSTVDTVERFQGGEKDIMAVSTTVSDPDHLSKEEDFILSENRLNVALSRMKKKLIVIASRSIFEMVPSDIETYDEARIWKSLYASANASGKPDWSGKVSDISDSGSNVGLDVYHINSMKED